MKIILTLLTIFISFSCVNEPKYPNGHHLSANGDELNIQYNGPAEAVQFKMVEGVEAILKKDKKGCFSSKLNIPGLEDGIFSYSIIVHRKDSAGNRKPVKYEPANGAKHFRWVGRNRDTSYSKSDSWEEKLERVQIQSEYLGEERQLTIYTPDQVSPNTPIIYMTDGMVAGGYAGYVDKLIADEKIVPIILAGVQASGQNRFYEYVNMGLPNQQFDNHEQFFYEEVFPTVENRIRNWEGKRYIYGFSNGAAFGMYAGINHPTFFEEVIAFSTAGYISGFIKPVEFRFDAYPSFIMGAGRYEESIFQNNKQFVEKLKNENIEVDFEEFIAGHDYYTWMIGFFEYISEEFSTQ